MAEKTPFGQELAKKMWVTKGARYNTYRRCKTKSLWSILSIAILSIYVIGLRLAPYFLVFNVKYLNILAFTTLLASLFILVLSLLEASKNYQLRAERLYNCANEITNVYNDLLQLAPYNEENGHTPEQIQKISKRYASILRRYQENHDVIDFELFKAKNRADFQIDWCSARRIGLRNICNTYGLYALLLTAPPVTLVIFYLTTG